MMRFRIYDLRMYAGDVFTELLSPLLRVIYPQKWSDRRLRNHLTVILNTIQAKVRIAALPPQAIQLESLDMTDGVQEMHGIYRFR